MGNTPCWVDPCQEVPHLGSPVRPGWGIPHPSWEGGTHLMYPPVGPGWGTPSDLARGYPTSGTPHQTWLVYTLSDLARVPPGQTWLGYPLPIRPGWATPIRPGWGTSPSGPGWGTPQAGPGWGTTSHCLARWGNPPPLWTDRRMDRHVSKHNLPSYYVCGR